LAALGAAPEEVGGRKILPFDVGRARRLYQALLAGAEDMISGKHLLVVASGPLQQLPFHVLVKGPGAGAPPAATRGETAVLGLELGPVPSSVRAEQGLGPEAGALVEHVVQGGVAARAGIRSGDILREVAGAVINGPAAAAAVIAASKPGARLALSLVRDGSQLDLEVVPEAAARVEPDPVLLGADAARSLRWLAREHAITVLPAVASLKALRRLATASRAPRPMIGFGNPLLDGPNARFARRAQLARDYQQCRAPMPEMVAAAGRTDGGVAPVLLRGGLADLAHLRSVPPLPETADELCAVARDLDARPDEIKLGARATEGAIKALSAGGALAEYRIVHFATHGTLAGELTGTREPGLILTPPASASEADDGYLSASEIAGLKLDADWVILSACNTAGPAGSGRSGAERSGEALSGLARAFFYAGARALLVSHWEVDSAAAVKIVTHAAGAIARDGGLGRAEALRRAMLRLVDAGRPHEAHPAIWAPFVVVGEGAAPQR
jgi:CHAT domain-containing protein